MLGRVAHQRATLHTGVIVRLLNIKKIQEGLYSAESLACPTCSSVLQIEIPGPNLFIYHQGAHAQDVLPDMSADDRERFISGVCGPCWNKMFAFEPEPEPED